MKPTQHAIKRWSERFPALDMAREYNAAKRVGRGTKKKLQAAVCRKIIGPYKGIHYVMAPCGAIFVCGKGELVVTVYPALERA
jgi:hypothetical protein